MIRRRVWRDAPIPEGRITLGRPTSVPLAKPHVEITVEHENTQAELLQTKARCALIESELQETQRKLREVVAVLAELQSSLQAERVRAQEQGHAAGLEAAQSAAKRELEAQLAQWQRALEELQRAGDAHWQSLRTELADVIMASLVKLLGEQMANPHAIRAAVEQALKESGASAPLRVLLAPTQYEQLMKSGAAQTGWFKERRLEIAPDARVTHGGCLLETQGGLIDGRFESQLTRLHEILSAHYAGSASR